MWLSTFSDFEHCHNSTGGLTAAHFTWWSICILQWQIYSIFIVRCQIITISHLFLLSEFELHLQHHLIWFFYSVFLAGLQEWGQLLQSVSEWVSEWGRIGQTAITLALSELIHANVITSPEGTLLSVECVFKCSLSLRLISPVKRPRPLSLSPWFHITAYVTWVATRRAGGVYKLNEWSGLALCARPDVCH